MPGPEWPNLLPSSQFTPADHAAHRSPKGIPYPHDLIPGASSTKMAKGIMKFAAKPHLKLTTKTKSAPRRKKKLR